MGGETKVHEQCCQLCFEFHPDVEICPWIYNICKAPGYSGIMKLTISQTLKNPKKRFIACQYSTYGSFKWLEDAIKESKSEEGTSFRGGCYGCGVCGHWWKDCPWRFTICVAKGYEAKMKLLIYGAQGSKGEKYLKCENPYCLKFTWLRDAMKAEEKRTSEKKLGADVKINVTMNLNDLCSEFKRKAKLG